MDVVRYLLSARSLAGCVLWLNERVSYQNAIPKQDTRMRPGGRSTPLMREAGPVRWSCIQWEGTQPPPANRYRRSCIPSLAIRTAWLMFDTPKAVPSSSFNHRPVTERHSQPSPPHQHPPQPTSAPDTSSPIPLLQTGHTPPARPATPPPPTHIPQTPSHRLPSTRRGPSLSLGRGCIAGAGPASEQKPARRKVCCA